MKKEIFTNIMKINWFIYGNIANDWKSYNRDDWINISLQDNEYVIANWIDWEIYCKNRPELIGQLALNWIINRLF